MAVHARYARIHAHDVIGAPGNDVNNEAQAQTINHYHDDYRHYSGQILVAVHARYARIHAHDVIGAPGNDTHNEQPAEDRMEQGFLDRSVRPEEGMDEEGYAQMASSPRPLHVIKAYYMTVINPDGSTYIVLKYEENH